MASPHRNDLRPRAQPHGALRAFALSDGTQAAASGNPAATHGAPRVPAYGAQLGDVFASAARALRDAAQRAEGAGGRTVLRACDSVHTLFGRICARAGSRDAMASRGAARLDEMLIRELRPFTTASAPRVLLDGPPVALNPGAASTLASAIRELAADAVEHGALGVSAGVVRATWRLSRDGALKLVWRETGAPAARPAARDRCGLRVIAEAISHDLDGSMDIYRKEDGMRIDLDLPRRHLSDADATERPAMKGSRKLLPEGCRALVVEDDALVALDFAELFLELGAGEVATAASVQEAMGALDAGPVDFALLDVQLGEQSSAPIADRLRREGAPFIVATGWRPEDLPEAFRGAPVCPKPCEPELLETVLTALLPKG